MLEEIQNTEDDINEQCESSVSNSQKNNRIKFNAFKSSCEYKKLQGYYGDVPISKFEKKVQEMFDNKEPCIISNYFFDAILSNLTFEQREKCEGSLLRLYISYFFVNNHCPSVIGRVLLEGVFIMENRILPLRTALSNNTKEGLYDVCKTKLSRQIIQKINVTIECFWVKRCVLLQRYQKLNGKSQFYDVIKTMHNNA